MAQKVFDLAVKTGTYTDNQGQEKGRWMNVGAVFKNDQGQVSIKLEAIPTGDWNGWISAFEPKQRNNQQQGQQQSTGSYNGQQQPQQGQGGFQQGGNGSADFDNSNIPF